MRVQLLLSLLRSTINDDTYARVLRTIGSGIKEAEVRVNMAHEENPKNLDMIVDDECDFVENLLGAAFVVCQTQINTVTSRALTVYGALPTASETSYPSDPYKLYGRGAEAGELSKVTGMVALANYFKHRSEWAADWSKQTGTAKHTISKVTKIGLKQNCSGNLRTGAEWLGNSSYEKTEIFVNEINAWSKLVLEDCLSLTQLEES